MALVIFSAGSLAESGLHTVRIRTLLAGVGVLALAGLLGGMALGFQLGSDAVTEAGDAQGLESLDLDTQQPGNRALIQQVGMLSGRLIRLEAEATRLAERVGAKTPDTAPEGTPRAGASTAPAGGPLVTTIPGGRGGFGASLVRLDRGLDELETAIGIVAATVERHDLDAMAFPSRPPVEGIAISSGFGRRLDPFTGRPARHTGFDYPAPIGTPILASAGGRVRRAGSNGAYGRTVEIDHGGGLVTRYGHASQILVKVGDLVLPGQEIATVGSSGRSTGPHVHFEILRDGAPVQPGPYLAHDAS
jgi:murein DD-endopeptidase MepM/ murein hydrolase activator NlpD